MRFHTIIGVLLFCAALSLSGCEKIVYNKRLNQTALEMKMISDAILAYHIEYSLLPLPSAGTEVQSNRDLYAVLHAPAGPMTGNPKGLGFIDAPSGSLVLGEFIDPWGLAYHIVIDHDGDGFVSAGEEKIPGIFAIWSSGKNRIDESGTGDDLCSWR